MAAPSVQNPPAQPESKSGKKKKAAKGGRTESPVPASVATPDKAGSVAPGEGEQGDAAELPVIRELLKNIRNVNKKITNASKTDSLIAEHADKSLEELVTLKIINADQKAQHLKKPGLLAQLSQLEEQVAQLKKVDQDYKARIASEKAELEKTLTEKLEKERADAVAELKETSGADAKKALHDGFLLLSQFLRLAATRREEGGDPNADENQALEGVLLKVYSGDENAVDAMLKLVEGADEATRSVQGILLQTTYAQVKAAAQAHAAPLYQAEPGPEEAEVPVVAAEPATDPTVAHANLTEIDAGTDTALVNGHPDSTANGVPANADVGDSAANAAAESQWDVSDPAETSTPQEEWVEVPRDPAETETGLAATPAAPANTQSWADEAAEHAPVEHRPSPTADGNDGFQSVQRNRGRENREGGGWRGGRGNHRGRGSFRGEGRGRGRGGRGGGAPHRGPRRDAPES